MAQSALQPPAYLQPRPKATPTFSNSSVTATGVRASSRHSSPSSQSRTSSPTRYSTRLDASSKSTAALVRRILCPHTHGSPTEPQRIEELLPPLTSSNSIDLQLYAIIAIVVKELIYSWYGKLTPDQVFVEEVVRIIAHCTRALEGRLRSVDLEGLFLDDIPGLIENHVNGKWNSSWYHRGEKTELIEQVTAYRISHQTMPASSSTDPQVIYHNLNPHPALSPVPNSREDTIQEQLDNEAAYRQLLVHGVLAVLLPTEELENACVRTLIADAIGETILGNTIGAKGSEGWFIWGSVIKIVEVVKAHLEPKATGDEMESDKRSRLEKFGLLSERGQSTEVLEHSQRSTFISRVFWQILQYGYLIFLGLRFVVLGFIAASSQAPRSPSRSNITQDADSPPIAKIVQTPEIRRPILKFRLFSLISVLLDLPLRMPWLSGLFSLLQHHMIHGPLKIGATNGLLDQYIHHLLITYLSPPTLLPPFLLSIRHALFPNASLPAPTPPAPSPVQQAAIKTACARSIASLVPDPILTRFFSATSAGRDGIHAAIERELDVWGDAYLNRHLAYGVLELVVVKVMPELGEMGVRALMEGRLGDIDVDMD